MPSLAFCIGEQEMADYDGDATCPFCDGSNLQQVGQRIVCLGCGAEGPPALTTTDRTVVWRKWNSRKCRQQWRDLESLIIKDVHSWGDHFGVEVRDLIGPERVPPIWQQVRQVLSRLLNR